MNHTQDNLTGRLQSWQVNPPSDSTFRHQVWKRIERGVGLTWPSYLRAHSASWSIAVVLTLSAAAYTGSALAHARTQADRESLVVTYLVDLDPRVQAVLKP